MKKTFSLSSYPEIFFQEINQQQSNANNKKSGEKITLKVSLSNTDGTTYQYEAFNMTTEPPSSLFKSEYASPQMDGTVQFANLLIMNFTFERVQPILFKIYRNMDGTQTTMEYLVLLGNIVRAPSGVLESKIQEDAFETITISASPYAESNEFLNLKMSIIEINYSYSSSFKLYYYVENNTTLYRSEYRSRYGDFQSVTIPANLIKPKFKIVYQNEDHTPLATYTTTVDRITDKMNHGKLDSFHVKKDYPIEVYNYSTKTMVYPFIDYIKNGVQIGLTIAIDFTGSNDYPYNKSSLHYISNGFINNYEAAIRACGSVISCYDYDQQFPVYGFGGYPKNIVGSYQCFNLNEEAEPEIHTIEEVCRIYREKTLEISFSGPTNFAPIISKVNETIRANNNRMNYNILMILTDGAISDMNNTIKEIVIGSKLPLSIIIVGIGNGNFGSMDALDSDDKLLTDRDNNQCIRDIVQFVPYNQFKTQEELAASVLEEIPTQINQYYLYENMNPYSLTK